MNKSIRVSIAIAIATILAFVILVSVKPTESEQGSYLRNRGANEGVQEAPGNTNVTKPLDGVSDFQESSEDNIKEVTFLEDATFTTSESDSADVEVQAPQLEDHVSTKLKIVVYETSQISTSLENLLAVAEKYGIDTTIVGQGTTFSGFGSKYAQLKETMNELNKDKNSLVALIDGRDVLLNVGSNVTYDAFHIRVNQFITTFKELTEGKPEAVLISGEQQCCVSALCYADTPDYYFDSETGERKNRACPSGTEGCLWIENDSVRYWESAMVSEARARSGSDNVSPYLNAGMMVGTPQNLINLIHRMDLGEEEDDQAVLSAMYLQFPELIVLDYKQQLLGNNAWPKGLEYGCIFDFAPSSENHEFLTNRETGTTPLLLHTPGKFYACLDTLIDRLGGVSDHRYNVIVKSSQNYSNQNYQNYGNPNYGGNYGGVRDDSNYGGYNGNFNYGDGISNYGGFSGTSNYGGGFGGSSNYGGFSGGSNYGGGLGGSSNYGEFSGNSNYGGFDSASNYGGGFSGNSNYGGFSGNSNYGGFDSASNYGGGFSGNSNYGGFSGNSNYGDFSGNSNYGGFDDSSNYGTVLHTSGPTVAPTATPTFVPTDAPTISPTQTPTAVPTATPTKSPTVAPSSSPTSNPTLVPTSLPTTTSSSVPSASPTVSPTLKPTGSPTSSPTLKPTGNPTASPSLVPTISPTVTSSGVPSVTPTIRPTQGPTGGPTGGPTLEPTGNPTASPTSLPTMSPSTVPSSVPTAKPTISPTEKPTGGPTGGPTSNPTPSPTALASAAPTSSPSSHPSQAPSATPTNLEELCEGSPFKSCCLAGNEICCSMCHVDMPTNSPTTKSPTTSPTAKPTLIPTLTKTDEPSSSPTIEFSAALSAGPTVQPSAGPTVEEVAFGSLASTSPTSSPTVDCSKCTTMMCDLTRIIWGCDER